MEVTPKDRESECFLNISRPGQVMVKAIVVRLVGISNLRRGAWWFGSSRRWNLRVKETGRERLILRHKNIYSKIVKCIFFSMHVRPGFHMDGRPPGQIDVKRCGIIYTII